MDTEERVEMGLKFRKDGYSCSQCVLMALTDKLGIDHQMAIRIGAGLGAGATCGELCGAVNAMAIAEGLKLKPEDATSDSKKIIMPKTSHLMKNFSEPFDGKLTCRDLKGKYGKTCEELIARAICLVE